MLTHPLFVTLKNLKGNPKSCVFTEPLWGIPFNLYAPYVSVYMLALGIKDSQIGLITSIGLVFQIIFALLSGAITDKLGRKRATLIFDILTWSISCLIWAASQNFTYFLVAAIFNSMWRIPMNSWSCLLVEDAQANQLVNIYSWIYISGLLAAFFSPIAGLFIHQFSLVPTMRGLYIFAFGLMTSKFFILNYYATETAQGQVRMQETRHQPLFSMLREYRGVFTEILKAPQTLFTLGIMLVMSISSMVNSTFWGILVTEKLRIPTQNIALYPFAKSTIMLLFFFVIMPRISSLHFKKPMLFGFGSFILSQVLLISMPEKSYLLLLVSTFLEACSVALVNPFLDSMLVTTVEPQERARILAIIYVIIITFTSPFGWIAGQLSEVNRVLPFVLNLTIFAAGAVLVLAATRSSPKKEKIIKLNMI